MCMMCPSSTLRSFIDATASCVHRHRATTLRSSIFRQSSGLPSVETQDTSVMNTRVGGDGPWGRLRTQGKERQPESWKVLIHGTWDVISQLICNDCVGQSGCFEESAAPSWTRSRYHPKLYLDTTLAQSGCWRHPLTQQWLENNHSCVIDADVDAPELFFDPREHVQHLVILGEVTLDGGQWLRVTLEFIRQGLCTMCVYTCLCVLGGNRYMQLYVMIIGGCRLSYLTNYISSYNRTSVIIMLIILKNLLRQ